MAEDNLEKGIRETTSFTTGSSFCTNGKRTDYIDWSEFFMGIAILAAKRSKDPKTQVGACIVNAHNKIVGIGYNGMPIGCNDDVFPWTKSDDPLQSKHSYVCHAELNAVLNKNCSDVHGCTIYVGLFPCNECAKVIIQSGIKEIVFMSDKNDDKTKASKRMLVAAGVKYRMFHPKRQKIELDFSDPRSELDNSITNLTIIDY